MRPEDFIYSVTNLIINTKKKEGGVGREGRRKVEERKGKEMGTGVRGGGWWAGGGWGCRAG